MSVVSTINQIDNQVATFAPLAIVAVQASEAAGNAAGASGAQKKAVAATAIFAGIQAGARVGETVPIPQVSAIAGLIDLVVSIFNAFGVFSHKPAPVASTSLAPPAE